MADRFFTQEACDRCGGSLKDGRIMSMFNTDCICMECKEKETKRPDYAAARDAEHAEVCKGNLNFEGVGYIEKNYCRDCKHLDGWSNYCSLIMDVTDEDDRACSWFKRSKDE